ncbi:unnamed protein product [Rotaria sordida]|uniref:UMOD/GP2/OIT3-like D8C domain-containing protein n=1 Tax=Rotaria sordida TaxID=392033 RepID=A0A814ZM78_9BILA|nr:unnamed protein product [Rotaria sordida]CAF1198113.1 unnamed protein product [Rotaria sordida]CAF1243531.1 unnamed protein product [Rotaria sordida]CAF1280533.1 unnamed protein product [Rotaria sordida]CAF1454754.1 unnamed protein product [Rotaria sordida]
MASKIQPYGQYPRYPVNASSSSNEKISDNYTRRLSEINLVPSSPKSKTFPWPTIFWIGLGILIFLALVSAIVIPIVVLSNKSDTVITTTISTICPTTSITTTVTASSLPAQCSSYTTITDDTRSPDNLVLSTCDDTILSTTPIWVRFTGSGGTLLASCPIDEGRCGADAPGWYSGIYPSLAGAVTSGYVCFNYNSDLCYWTISTLVTNCNGFYVYYLYAPPACTLRYCTI